jgi:hypothetical protein
MSKDLVKAEWAKKFSAWGDFDVRCMALVREYGLEACRQGSPRVHSEVHTLCDSLGCPFSVVF